MDWIDFYYDEGEEEQEGGGGGGQEGEEEEEEDQVEEQREEAELEEEEEEEEDDSMEVDVEIAVLEGQVPTRKRRRLARQKGLRLSLESGLYPEYLGMEGPYVRHDPASTSPFEYFKLMWPQSLCELIVEETNRYARQCGTANWVDVDSKEIWTFLGLCLEMSVHKLPRIRDYWSTENLLRVDAVHQHMALNRFFKLRTNLHVVDNSSLSPDDGMSRKVEPLLSVLRDTFFRNYSPGQELSVDEAMIKFKGRVHGSVVMPKKPIKRGFKVFCCCCSCCGYLCTFEVYNGKPKHPVTGAPMTETGLVKRVVKDLLSPFIDLNHVVYMDNFFTSGPLINELALEKIYVVGTIKQRAQGFPASLKGVKPEQGKFVTKRVGGIQYSVFNDRKCVSFATNAFPGRVSGAVARVQPGGLLGCQSVPPLLPAYNTFMGGVDRSNQLRKTYGYDRKARRYWLRIFFQFFDYAIVNAYALYKNDCRHYGVKEDSPLQFRLRLIKLFCTDARHRKRKGNPSCSSAASRSFVRGCRLKRLADMNLTRGRCLHCLQTGRSPVRHTSFGCGFCGVRLCKIDCFKEFHDTL